MGKEIKSNWSGKVQSGGRSISVITNSLAVKRALIEMFLGAFKHLINQAVERLTGRLDLPARSSDTSCS